MKPSDQRLYDVAVEAGWKPPATLPPGWRREARRWLIPCCYGVAFHEEPIGGRHCTCWEPIFATDEKQQDPRPGMPVARTTRCDSCACFVPSGHLPDGRDIPPDLEEAYYAMLAARAAGTPFWCHKGLRLRVAERHPLLGVRPAAHPTDAPDRQDVPIVDDVPYKLDGSPADLCFAWSRMAPE